MVTERIFDKPQFGVPELCSIVDGSIVRLTLRTQADCVGGSGVVARFQLWSTNARVG